MGPIVPDFPWKHLRLVELCILYLVMEKDTPPLECALASDETPANDIEGLKKYRDTICSDIVEHEKEYHKIITYVAAGALGLFLTINEKVFNLRTAKYPGLLMISISFLFLALILFIVNTIMEIRTNERLRDKADEMIDKNFYDKEALRTEWLTGIRPSRLVTYGRFVLLVLGIAAEVIFIVKNMY